MFEDDSVYTYEPTADLFARSHDDSVYTYDPSADLFARSHDDSVYTYDPSADLFARSHDDSVYTYDPSADLFARSHDDSVYTYDPSADLFARSHDDSVYTYDPSADLFARSHDDSVYTYDPSADLFARSHDDSSMEGVTESSTVGCPVADAAMAEDSKQSTAMDLRTVIHETQVHGQVAQKSQKPRIRTSTRPSTSSAINQENLTIRLRATMVDEWLNNEDEYNTYVPDINLQDEAPRFLLRDQFDGDLVFNFTFRTCLVCHTSNFTEFMYLQLRFQPKRCNDNVHVPSNNNHVHPCVGASVICYCSKCGSKYVSERTKLRSEEAAPGSMGETSHFLEDENDERNGPRVLDDHGLKNTVPRTYKEAVSKVKELLPRFETFHVCKNDCVLYTGDLMGATECPKCRETRFDDRGKAKKENFYFPLLETVRTLYAAPQIASMLQEHGLTLSEDVPQYVSDIRETAMWNEMHKEGKVQFLLGVHVIGQEKVPPHLGINLIGPEEIPPPQGVNVIGPEKVPPHLGTDLVGPTASENRPVYYSRRVLGRRGMVTSL
ncbi:hypothetical protein Bbelb_048690 [Branchiostoma belcheri]|nr:hypothetical protein Bbelb_048690 [Branchiostoma belcheri]